MKAVILNDYASVTGGSTAVALASAIELARRGMAVTLLTAVGPVAEAVRNVPNLEVVCLEQPEIVADPNRLRAFVRGVYNREAVGAVRRTLAKHDPRETVVHVHTWTKALSPFAISAAIERGFKVIVTLHDFSIACPTGGLFIHRSSELCERRPLSVSCLSCSCDRRSHAHKLWRSARFFAQNRSLRLPRRISHFVGVSGHSIRIMRRYLPTEAAVTLVRNPAGGADAGPAPVGENAPFLFIGRFAKEKGVLLFAEAARRVGAPAVFIGDGELRAEAEQICPDATFTGWLPARETNAWIRKARALVFPPLWYETLGLVVIEAAAHGVPAIVASKCAATDFSRDGETGLWFEHGSTSSLVACMERLRDQPTLAAALGARAYGRYWADPWTVERHGADLVNLYEQVLTPAHTATS